MWPGLVNRVRHCSTLVVVLEILPIRMELCWAVQITGTNGCK